MIAVALGNPPGVLDAGVVNSPAYRASEVPAANGHGTARGIARFFACLAAGGELDGVRLLQAVTVDEALRPQATGRDVVLESDVTCGLGLQTDPGDGSFGLGGIGGFSGFGVRRPGVSLEYGYVTCALGDFERTQACEGALETLLRDSKHSRSTLAP